MAWRAGAAKGGIPRSQTMDVASSAAQIPAKQPRGGQRKVSGNSRGSDDNAPGAGHGETVLMQKLSLSAAQMVRMMPGSMWDFFLTEGGLEPIEAAAAGGANYAEEVKTEGSKVVGPPHLHIGVEFFPGMAKAQTLEGEATRIIQELGQLIVMVPMEVRGHPSLFQGGESLPRARPTQPTRWNIHIVFNPLNSTPWTKNWEGDSNHIRQGNTEELVTLGQLSVQDLRVATRRVSKLMKAEQMHGAFPPTALER
ncbi:unnamed protein product [Prorocentrum cordatum]|uniref:Protein arginine methyltransferase NDUFAF7 n=1 Tax=Prorocentrum cordatum TaxID=2364126 RepID=A0ABN9SFX2_9DINO|nr:unnamed protein product [Polarella glacialis]